MKLQTQGLVMALAVVAQEEGLVPMMQTASSGTMLQEVGGCLGVVMRRARRGCGAFLLVSGP